MAIDEDDNEPPQFVIPRKKKRKHETHYLVQQRSGQFVYKYKDDAEEWHSKRLPRSIVFKADAVKWVNVNMLGARDDTTKLANLRALANRATTDGEREAALRAIARIEGKNK